MTLQRARDCYLEWHRMSYKLVEMNAITDYVVPDEQQCL